MRVYITEEGGKTWEKVEEEGKRWARKTLGLTDSELEALEALYDCEKLRSDEIGECRVPIFRKLEKLGLCGIEE